MVSIERALRVECQPPIIPDETQQIPEVPSIAETLWLNQNEWAKKEGINRENSLVFDFTESETPQETAIRQFNDGEFLIKINRDIIPSGQTAAYFLSSVLTPERAFLLSQYADGLRQLGIREITLVCPYFGFTRGDKPAPDILPYVESRGLRAMSQVVTGFCNRLFIVEPHSPETVDYFSQELKKPVVAFSLWRYLTDKFLALPNINISNLVVVGPDKGRGKVAVLITQYLKVPLVSLDKKRDPLTGQVTVSDLTPEQIEIINGREAVGYDDVITTGGTLNTILKKLEQAGVNGFTVLSAHGVFCGPKAIENLIHPLIRKIISGLFIKLIVLKPSTQILFTYSRLRDSSLRPF